MAAVATDLAREGYRVTGSDSQFYPPMSDLLSQSPVVLFRQFAPENLPAKGLVIVGNAVSRGNIELEAALNRNLPLLSLPELIRDCYLTNTKTLVIAGTHGKTTTTSLAAHILQCLGTGPGWMVGGDPVDLPFACQHSGGGMFVIEGDEYDTAWFDKRPKFLLYRPYHAIVTSIEFDHSDIYANIGEIESAFRRFVGLLPEQGCLICFGDSPRVREVCASSKARIITYGTAKDCDWRVEDITSPGSDGAIGKIFAPDGWSREMRLKTAGSHNLLNALSVLAFAVETGHDREATLHAISSFQGVARRLQLRAKGGGIVLYDDFAHHPTAIKTTLEAVRRKHPEGRLWALFEPRSNTMVRNFFQQELEEALAVADRIVLGPLHRREKIPADQRLDTERIVKRMGGLGKPVVALDRIEGAAAKVMGETRPGDVIVVMSNGAFGGLTNELTEAISAIGTI